MDDINDTSDADLHALMRHLDKLAYAGEWETLDALYDALDTRKENVIISITYLRYLFMGRDKFEGWARLRDRFRDDLIGRGRDPDSVLRGLYSPTP